MFRPMAGKFGSDFVDMNRVSSHLFAHVCLIYIDRVFRFSGVVRTQQRILWCLLEVFVKNGISLVS